MENLLSYLQHAETKSVRKSLTSSIPFRKLLEDFISKIMSRSCKGLKCSLHKAKTKPCSYTLYEESCFYLTKRWLAVLRVKLDWRSPSGLQSCPFHHGPCFRRFRRLTESGTSPPAPPLPKSFVQLSLSCCNNIAPQREPLYHLWCLTRAIVETRFIVQLKSTSLWSSTSSARQYIEGFLQRSSYIYCTDTQLKWITTSVENLLQGQMKSSHQ